MVCRNALLSVIRSGILGSPAEDALLSLNAAVSRPTTLGDLQATLRWVGATGAIIVWVVQRIRRLGGRGVPVEINLPMAEAFARLQRLRSAQLANTQILERPVLWSSR